MTPIGFQSSLARWFEPFVQLKVASGSTYQSQINILRGFDQHLWKQGAATADVGATTLGNYLALKPEVTPRTKANLVSVIWPAVDYAIRHGAGCPMLSVRPSFPKTRTRVPTIFSENQIAQLLGAARHLSLDGGSKLRLRSHTYATFFGLLVNTGLRVGEAQALALADLEPDSGFLMVREGKFRKSRRLPLRASTIAALTRYIRQRGKAGMPSGSDSPLFVNRLGKPLIYENARQVFLRLVRTIGMGTFGALPSIHCLRHTFAVRRVIAWYRAGVDVNSRLQALSTYMGHSSIEHTLVYLSPNEELLREAAQRFEARCAPPLLRSEEVTSSCR